jgi:hypothetical protein
MMFGQLYGRCLTRSDLFICVSVVNRLNGDALFSVRILDYVVQESFKVITTLLPLISVYLIPVFNLFALVVLFQL